MTVDIFEASLTGKTTTPTTLKFGILGYSVPMLSMEILFLSETVDFWKYSAKCEVHYLAKNASTCERFPVRKKTYWMRNKSKEPKLKSKQNESK